MPKSPPTEKDYSAATSVLSEHWEAQTSAEFREALEALKGFARSGDEMACAALAEILALSGPHHDAAAAYKWYYIAFAQQEGYLVAFCNEHSDPGYYCGPVGDFRNESMVSDLVVELGLACLAQLDGEAQAFLESVSNE